MNVGTRALVVAGTAVAGLAIFVAVAVAHFDTGLYTHSECPADNYDRVDPINIV
jgi:hypothetical protein